MALDIIGGLEAAHHRGVVHRDVKPANIFFDARGTAKLGDFGVAHLVDLGQTQTGGLIGTLAYMSPEQITGAPISIAADLYALGVTLFEVVTGRLPFLGPDFVAQHLGEEPPLAIDGRARASPPAGIRSSPACSSRTRASARRRSPICAASSRRSTSAALPRSARAPRRDERAALDRAARRRRTRSARATSSRRRSARRRSRSSRAPSTPCSIARS